MKAEGRSAGQGQEPNIGLVDVLSSGSSQPVTKKEIELSKPFDRRPAGRVPDQLTHAATTADIYQLVSDSFDDGELETLCFLHFRPVHNNFGSGMGRLVKIQLLIDHCIRYGKKELLLEKVRESNLYQFERFLNTLQNRIPHSPPPPGHTRRVGIVLDGEFKSLTAEVKEATIRMLAAVLEVDPQEIKIERVKRGSIIMVLSMSQRATEKLQELFQKKDPIIVGKEGMAIQLVKVVPLTKKDLLEYPTSPESSVTDDQKP
jgi:hypothetical protein